MSRVRNALDFRQRYHQARERYDNIHRPRIEAARSRYNDHSYTSEEDDLLEAQVREYFVDALLTALNWQLDSDSENGLPNLIPEAQLRSTKSGKTRFLDYFGLTGTRDDPLLVVETKRPNSLLPRKKEAFGKRSISNVPEDSVAAVLSAGLKGTSLTEDWNEWLDTLRDYVTSVFDRSKHVPGVL